MTLSTEGLRVEFDYVNRMSMLHVEGRLADESLTALYETCRDHSNAAAALVSIVDLSFVSEFALSSASIQNLAYLKPATADAKRLCFIIALPGLGFGLCRMFQLLAENTRPLLRVVHTLAEVFAAIGTPSPYFEPSGVRAPVGAGYPSLLSCPLLSAADLRSQALPPVNAK
jgi:hypothetical protein